MSKKGRGVADLGIDPKTVMEMFDPKTCRCVLAPHGEDTELRIYPGPFNGMEILKRRLTEAGVTLPPNPEHKFAGALDDFVVADNTPENLRTLHDAGFPNAQKIKGNSHALRVDGHTLPTHTAPSPA